MINELGPNDWRFKAIKQEFETGDSQAVGQVCCNNPSAKWEQVEDALLNADYSDMVQFSDELGIEQDSEEKMITEIQRLQQLAGLLNESALGAAYAERELDGDASRQMHEMDGDAPAISDDHSDNEEIDDREEFSIGDYVFVKSQRQAGHIMAFNHGEGLITVRLYSGKPIKVDPDELELMDDDDEEDHEGTWADFKGDERFFNEEEGKVIPFTPKKERGVRVQDFEDDSDGNLDDYVAKLVAQQMNKGKQIQFTPKK